MSATSFLYLLTGCLDLVRNPGQKKQRLPQAGKTWRDTTPETELILDIVDEQSMKMGLKILPFLSLPNLWGFGCWEGKERLRIEMGTSQIQWPACDQQQLHLQVTNLKTIEKEYKCGFKNYPKKKERIEFDERCESYLGWKPARAGTEAGNFRLCHAATGIPADSTASLPLLGI